MTRTDLDWIGLVIRSYSIVLKSKTLPMSLITDSTKVERMNLLSTESFQETFGPGKQRKRYVENDNGIGIVIERGRRIYS